MYTPWQDFKQFIGLQGFELIRERPYDLANWPRNYRPSVLIAGHREKFLLLHAVSMRHERSEVFNAGKIVGCLDLGPNPSQETLEVFWQLNCTWGKATRGTYFFSLNLAFNSWLNTLAIIEQCAKLVPWVGLFKAINIGAPGEEASLHEQWWTFRQAAPSWVRAFIQ